MHDVLPGFGLDGRTDDRNQHKKLTKLIRIDNEFPHTTRKIHQCTVNGFIALAKKGGTMAAAVADLWRDNSSAVTVTVTVLAASTLVSVGLLWCGSAFPRRRHHRRPKRRWSITSTTMGFGAYHPSINSPEAIINACIVFQNCPTVDDVVKLVVPKMLEYKRMATIPVLQTRTERPCVDLDPSKLVRQVEVEGDDDAMYEKVKEYLHEPLSSGRGDLPWWEILIINVRNPFIVLGI
jgi:hypothetical protein